MAFMDARERAFLTQDEAAERIGVSQVCVHAWETGKWLPRSTLLPKIASVYGCTIDDLFRQKKH